MARCLAACIVKEGRDFLKEEAWAGLAGNECHHFDICQTTLEFLHLCNVFYTWLIWSSVELDLLSLLKLQGQCIYESLAVQRVGQLRIQALQRNQ